MQRINISNLKENDIIAVLYTDFNDPRFDSDMSFRARKGKVILNSKGIKMCEVITKGFAFRTGIVFRLDNDDIIYLLNENIIHKTKLEQEIYELETMGFRF